MAGRPELTGGELREAMRMAAEEMSAVQGNIKQLGEESRVDILEGEDRAEFFRGMTQDEFQVLHDLAFSLGGNGMTALERLMGEAQETYKKENSDAS